MDGVTALVLGGCFLVLAAALKFYQSRAAKAQAALFKAESDRAISDIGETLKRLRDEAEEFDRRRNDPSIPPDAG